MIQDRLTDLAIEPENEGFFRVLALLQLCHHVYRAYFYNYFTGSQRSTHGSNFFSPQRGAHGEA